MLTELVYATTNDGKVKEITKLLNHSGFQVTANGSLEVEETGNTLEDNASLKVQAYRSLPEMDGKLILADDTGLQIDALDGMPGIHVRRWRDGKTKMGDEEIIRYCLEQLKGVPSAKRLAQFRTVLALGLPNGKIEVFDGTLKGRILEQASSIRVEGFPFESLFYFDKWGMLLGEAHKLPADKQGDRLNHRELALQKAVPRIRKLMEELD
jgi:XTP/dITP diphosphohydrolase